MGISVVPTASLGVPVHVHCRREYVAGSESEMRPVESKQAHLPVARRQVHQCVLEDTDKQQKGWQGTGKLNRNRGANGSPDGDGNDVWTCRYRRREFLRCLIIQAVALSHC